jgi:hypothetical protein
MAMSKFGNFQDEGRGLSAVEISYQATKNRCSMILLIRLSKILADPVRTLKPKDQFNIPPWSGFYGRLAALTQNDHLREPTACSSCGVVRSDFDGG